MKDSKGSKSTIFLGVLLVLLTLIIPVHAWTFPSPVPNSFRVRDDFAYIGVPDATKWTNVIQPCWRSKCNTLTAVNSGTGFLQATNHQCDYGAGACQNGAASMDLVRLAAYDGNPNNGNLTGVLAEEFIIPNIYQTTLCADYLAQGAARLPYHKILLDFDQASPYSAPVVIEVDQVVAAPCNWSFNVLSVYTSVTGVTAQTNDILTGIAIGDTVYLSIEINPDSSHTVTLIVNDITRNVYTSNTISPKLALGSGNIGLHVYYLNDESTNTDSVQLRVASGLEFEWDWANLTNTGTVSINDVGVCNAVYGQSDSYSQSADYCDFNRSGVVDLIDIGIMYGRYGITWPISPYPGQGQASYVLDPKWSTLCPVLPNGDQPFCFHMFP